MKENGERDQESEPGPEQSTAERQAARIQGFLALIDRELAGREGVGWLESKYEDPHSFAINTALASVIALRIVPDTVATGRDVSVLKSPAVDLSIEVTRKLAEPDDERYSHLLQQIIETQPRREPSDIQSLFMLYSKTLENCMERQDAMTIEQRQHMLQNLRPGIEAVRRLFSGYIDCILDKTQLLHEGGDLEGFDMDLYRDFADPFYLQTLYGGKKAAPIEQGLTGQTQMRLILDARYLDIVSYDSNQQKDEN